jgi:CheY-like chemotaxis protein
MPTLLLADDSVTIQRVIELTFADEDVRVVAVSTGDQAIAAMDEQVPDIVLADVGMPGPNGYEVARYIRETPRLAQTRVLLLAGAFDPVDRDRAAAVGCDGVLVKPFEPQQVIARVRELLERPRGAGAPVSQTLDGQPSEARSPEPAGPAATAVSVDEYFERLDQALGGNTASAPTGVAPDPPPATSPPAQTPLLPPLADAFAALLAAEQAGTLADVAGWPARAAAPPDALVEEVVRRVLERLSSTVVRAEVADLVSATAERLVREEIERIKASIDGPPAD